MQGQVPVRFVATDESQPVMREPWVRYADGATTSPEDRSSGSCIECRRLGRRASVVQSVMTT